MNCTKCGSSNVNIDTVVNTYTKNGHGIIYWLFIGWWWVPIKFILFGFFAIFMRKKKTVNENITRAVCQDCGHSWTISVEKNSH